LYIVFSQNLSNGSMDKGEKIYASKENTPKGNKKERQDYLSR
jgi:hypothetical protein